MVWTGQSVRVRMAVLRQRNGSDRVKRQRVKLIIRLLAGRHVAQGMRMIVDGFDLCNLGDKLRISSSLRRRLRSRKNRNEHQRRKSQQYRSLFHLFTFWSLLADPHSYTINRNGVKGILDLQMLGSLNCQQHFIRPAGVRIASLQR
jgi:hypothetical protein